MPGDSGHSRLVRRKTGGAGVESLRALDKSVCGCRFQRMNPTYTAIVKNDGDWWIGWIEEVPGVNAQEKTKADLLQSLREILHEALEFSWQK